MGTVINNLNKVSGGSTSSNNPFTTTFKTKAGTTYQICAGAVISQLNGSGGLMQFTLTTSPYTYSGTLYGPEVPTAPTPVNDSFYTPQVLTGNLLTVIGSTANATTEPGEQAFTKTLWHSWQAPSNKLVSIDFPPNTSGGFGIYTGDTLQSAVQVEPRSDSTNTSLKFDAQAGVTYKLVIGSITGQHQFVLTATDPPPVAPVTPVAPVAPVTPNPPANPGTPVTPDDGYTEPPVVNYGPASKITFPKNGQVVTTKGFKFKGNFESYDGYDIVAFEFSIDNKKFIRSTYPTKKSLFSGKLKKGKRILKMRSLDSSGVWGPYDTITVRVK